MRTCLKRAITSTNTEFGRPKKKVKFQDNVQLRVYKRNSEEWTRWALFTVDGAKEVLPKKSEAKTESENRIAKLEAHSVAPSNSAYMPELEPLDEENIMTNDESSTKKIPFEFSGDKEHQVLSQIAESLHVPPMSDNECAEFLERHGTGKSSHELCVEVLNLLNFSNSSSETIGTYHGTKERATEKKDEHEGTPIDEQSYKPEDTSTEKAELFEKSVDEGQKGNDDEEIVVIEQTNEKVQSEQKQKEREQSEEEEKQMEEGQIEEEEEEVEEDDEEDEEVEDVMPLDMLDNFEEDCDEQMSGSSQQPIVIRPAARHSIDNECRVSTSVQSDSNTNIIKQCSKARVTNSIPISTSSQESDRPVTQKQSPPISQNHLQPSPSQKTLSSPVALRESHSTNQNTYLSSKRPSAPISEPTIENTNRQQKVFNVNEQTRASHLHSHRSRQDEHIWWLSTKEKRRKNKKRRKEREKKRYENLPPSVPSSVPLNQLLVVPVPLPPPVGCSAAFSPLSSSITLPSQPVSSPMDLCSPQKSPPRPPHPIPPPPAKLPDSASLPPPAKLPDSGSLPPPAKLPDSANLPPRPSQVFKVDKRFYFASSLAVPQPVTDFRLQPFVEDCTYLFTHGYCSYTTKCIYSHGDKQRTFGWLNAQQKAIIAERRALLILARKEVNQSGSPTAQNDSNMSPPRPLSSIIYSRPELSPARLRRSNSHDESPPKARAWKNESPSACFSRRSRSPSTHSYRVNFRRSTPPTRSNSRSRRGGSPTARSRRSSRPDSPAARPRRRNSRHRSPPTRSRRSNSRSRPNESPGAYPCRSRSLLR